MYSGLIIALIQGAGMPMMFLIMKDMIGDMGKAASVGGQRQAIQNKSSPAAAILKQKEDESLEKMKERAYLMAGVASTTAVATFVS
jgi:hypothetical protein